MTRLARPQPSIDARFRSAAQAYGAATIGVVLTGYLAEIGPTLRALVRS